MKEFLIAEAKVVKWCAARAEQAVAVGEGREKAQQRSTEEQWALEKQFGELEQVCEVHRSEMDEAGLQTFDKFIREVHRELYYLEPRPDEDLEMEKEGLEEEYRKQWDEMGMKMKDDDEDEGEGDDNEEYDGAGLGLTHDDPMDVDMEW